MAQPQRGRQPFDLQQAHIHADHPHDRPDRQVNVAGDDDQHHARGHDPDIGGLHRQVPQVARRQKAVRIGLRRAQQQRGTPQDKGGIGLKGHPDQQQGAHHAQEAGVNLGCTQKTANGAFRIGICLGGMWGVAHDLVQPVRGRLPGLPSMPHGTQRTRHKGRKTTRLRKKLRRHRSGGAG